MNGIEAGEQIKRRLPDTRIIYFVAETTWRSQALALGADAFLLKDTPIDTLIRTIRGVVAARSDAAPPSPTAARPGARGGRIARPQRLTESGGIRPLAAAVPSRSGDGQPPSQITPSQTTAPPRAGRNITLLLRQIRSAASALDRAVEELESVPTSPGKPTDRDQEAAANSGMAAALQATLELLQAFAGVATGQARSQARFRRGIARRARPGGLCDATTARVRRSLAAARGAAPAGRTGAETAARSDVGAAPIPDARGAPRADHPPCRPPASRACPTDEIFGSRGDTAGRARGSPTPLSGGPAGRHRRVRGLRAARRRPARAAGVSARRAATTRQSHAGQPWVLDCGLLDRAAATAIRRPLHRPAPGHRSQSAPPTIAIGERRSWHGRQGSVRPRRASRSATARAARVGSVGRPRETWGLPAMKKRQGRAAASAPA